MAWYRCGGGSEPVHNYGIPLAQLITNKVWFYLDTKYSVFEDTLGSGLMLRGDDANSSWTTFSAVGIDLNDYTVPQNLSKIKVHFNTLKITGYAGVKVITSDTLWSGAQQGSDAILKANGLYQYLDTSGVTLANDYLEVPCTNADLTGQYLYIVLADGLIPNTTSGYQNNYNGTYFAFIDGIDFVTT